MNRLPNKFEEEVLSKHGIEWEDSCCTWADYSERGYQNKDIWDFENGSFHVSDYEIAGIALEAMPPHEYWKDSVLNHYHIRLASDIDNQFIDEDFCECIFKAVKEIWKDE